MTDAHETEAKAPRQLASRAELVTLLRGAGVAKGAAAKIATAGWQAINGHDEDAAADAEIIEGAARLLETLRAPR